LSEGSIACDSVRQGSPPSECQGVAIVRWICHIEGREVRLCAPCDRAWKEMASKTANMKLRCPNCASNYHATRQMNGSGEHRTGPADAEPLTGPLADAFTRALLAEGIPSDARARILARLATDSDPYVSSLLRSVSGAAA
jgi:hypothetical protein